MTKGPRATTASCNGRPAWSSARKGLSGARIATSDASRLLLISVSMWDWRVLLGIFRFQLGLELSLSPLASVPIETENSVAFGFKPTRVVWVIEKTRHTFIVRSISRLINPN
jgi:hypothetical protein